MVLTETFPADVEPLIVFCSFGVVCYEIATLRHPFSEMEEFQVVHAVMMRQETPGFPDGRPSQELMTLMGNCWLYDPVRRVDSFETIIDALDEHSVQVGGDPRECDGSNLVRQPCAATGGNLPSSPDSSPSRPTRNADALATENVYRGVVVESVGSPTYNEGMASIVSLVAARACSQRTRHFDFHSQKGSVIGSPKGDFCSGQS